MASTSGLYFSSMTSLAMVCPGTKEDVRIIMIHSPYISNLVTVMHRQAANVMKHLEMKREAAERRRVALMSKGIAKFLERTSPESYLGTDGTSVQEDVLEKEEEEEEHHHETHGNPAKTSPDQKESVLDKIRTTLDHAADILRESLELSSGGVVFLDTSTGYMENDRTKAFIDSTTDFGAEGKRMHRKQKGRQGSDANLLRPDISQNVPPTGRHLSQGAIRSSTDKHKASKILAMCSGKGATWDPSSRTLDAKTLQSLIKSYPQGNVWYMDEEGYFSSLEQISEWERRSGISPSGKRRSISPINVTKKKAEAATLSYIFHGARQIIFLPLWDAGGGMNDLAST
jgi:hypothetical protein